MSFSNVDRAHIRRLRVFVVRVFFFFFYQNELFHSRSSFGCIYYYFIINYIKSCTEKVLEKLFVYFCSIRLHFPQYFLVFLSLSLFFKFTLKKKVFFRSSFSSVLKYTQKSKFNKEAFENLIAIYCLCDQITDFQTNTESL